MVRIWLNLGWIREGIVKMVGSRWNVGGIRDWWVWSDGISRSLVYILEVGIEW